MLRKVLIGLGAVLLLAVGYAVHWYRVGSAKLAMRDQGFAYLRAMNAGDHAKAQEAFAFFGNAVREAPDWWIFYSGYFEASRAAGRWEQAQALYAQLEAARPRKPDPQWSAAAAHFHFLEAKGHFMDSLKAMEAGRGEETLQANARMLESLEKGDALDAETVQAFEAKQLRGFRERAKRMVAAGPEFARLVDASAARLRGDDASARSLAAGSRQPEALGMLAAIALEEGRYGDASGAALAAEAALRDHEPFLSTRETALGNAIALNGMAYIRQAKRTRSKKKAAQLAAKAKMELERSLAVEPQGKAAAQLRQELGL